MKVKLDKAMCFGGVASEAGSVVDVADSLARELIAQRRATPADGAAPPPAGPMTTETATALLGETATKGKTNARS